MDLCIDIIMTYVSIQGGRGSGPIFLSIFVIFIQNFPFFGPKGGGLERAAPKISKFWKIFHQNMQKIAKNLDFFF